MLFARGHCCSPHTRGGRLLSGRHAAVFRLVILKKRIDGYFRKVIYIFDRDARRSGPTIHFVGLETLIQNLL